MRLTVPRGAAARARTGVCGLVSQTRPRGRPRVGTRAPEERPGQRGRALRSRPCAQSSSPSPADPRCCRSRRSPIPSPRPTRCHRRRRHGDQPRRPAAAPGQLPAAARARRSTSAWSARAASPPWATTAAGWSVGDEVCALLAGGGYAEQVAVPVGQLHGRSRGRVARRRGRAARGDLHGVVDGVRPDRRPPATGRAVPGARRDERHRHDGDPDRARPRRRGLRHRRDATQGRDLPRARRRPGHQLPRRRLRGRHRRAHRRRAASTSSSTTWARATCPATSPRWPPAAG